MYRITYLLLVLVLISACSTKKNVVFMQDLSSESLYNVEYKEYTVRVDDILKIDVKSETPEISEFLNFDGSSTTLSQTRESLVFSGYIVDKNGNINFPALGYVQVKGFSVNQIIKIITDKIIDKGLLTDPIIDIKILNSNFTIIGEVKSPGRYDYLENNLNLLEAIGIAGDLTINGRRDDVKIIREKDGKQNVINVDLTSSEFITGDAFQIFSGDIIIVNPNSSKIKNAGIIGNFGTLLSVLSFVLSSIIVINR